MTRPNVLVVIADQLRADAVGAFGSAQASTPNLDHLAQRGTRFDNAFVQHSVCAPSRAALLTGQYPHVRGRRTLWNLLETDEPNLLRYFKEDGYRVVHVGERGDTFAPGATETSCHEYGFDTRPTRPLGGLAWEDKTTPMARAFYYGRTDPSDIDFDEAAVRTVESWLQEPSQEPWLLYVPLIAPHCPFATPEP